MILLKITLEWGKDSQNIWEIVGLILTNMFLLDIFWKNVLHDKI